jgi:L,D-transpeptidase ErfK/SrfK
MLTTSAIRLAATAIVAAALSPIAAARSTDTMMTVVGRQGTRLAGESLHIVPAWSGERPTVLVNIPQRLLFLPRASTPTAFPVAVGRSDWPTPTGEFAVAVKEVQPTWDVPVSIQEEMRRSGKPVITRMAPGPTNPLGSHWIGLDAGSIGIHGTPFPATLWGFSTHGCIRVHPDDIPRVYDAVALGDRVQIVYQPILAAVVGDDVFLEVHPDAYRRAPGDALTAARQAVIATERSHRVDWDFVAQVVRRHEGIARRIGASHD